ASASSNELARNDWYSARSPSVGGHVRRTYSPRQWHAWTTNGLAYGRNRFGTLSRTSRSNVSARGGGMLDTSGMFAGVEAGRGQGVLHVPLERGLVLAEHEQVGRDAVVVAERGVRPAVPADVAELNLRDRQPAVRLPERHELLRIAEQLDVVAV